MPTDLRVGRKQSAPIGSPPQRPAIMKTKVHTDSGITNPDPAMTARPEPMPHAPRDGTWPLAHAERFDSWEAVCLGDPPE